MNELGRRLRSVWSRLFGARRRDTMSARFAEEAAYHLEQQVARNRSLGMSEAAATRAAQVAFGGGDRFAEAARDEVRSRALEELHGDVRFSLRTLRRAPAFAAASIATLALGIGATTVIFTVTDHVVLRPLAYPDAERLVLVREVIEQVRERIPSLPANAGHFLYWSEHCGTCAAIGAILPTELTLQGGGEAQRVPAARMSAALLPMLGARAQLGRLFTAGEDAEGAERVVVLTDGYWRRRFGARPDVLGEQLSVNGEPATVIGVLAPGFALPTARALGSPGASTDRMELFLPLALTQQERSSPGAFNYLVVARLAAGASLEQARAEFDRFAKALSVGHPGGMHFSALVLPLHEQVVGGTGRALVLLLAAVGALLLIVCVNLANLLLARNAARLRESAVRTALGAGRGRLVRQALTESLVLALVGGVLGVVLSHWGLAALLHFAPATLPRLDEIALDGRVLAVSLLVSVAAGVIFGVLPALRFGHTDPAETLRSQGGRTLTEGRGGVRARNTLVAAQVALSALLLVGTGLLLASFARVLRVDRGFEVDRALAVDVSLPGTEYRSAAERLQFFEAAAARLRALPGVTHAAVASALPVEGDVQVDVLSHEHDARPAAERLPTSIRWVSPDYFPALGTRWQDGRAFGGADRGRPVVVLSERAAAAMWPGESALGKRLWPGSNDTLAEVVGVVADIRTAGLEQPGTAVAYVPLWQNPPRTATLVLRTSVDPATLAPAVRAELRALAPGVPVSRVRTMEDIMAAALAERRFQLLVLALFALTALVTASVGIYGVAAQSMRRRTAELGVRLALGARPRDVQRLVVREGVAPVVVGLASGLLLAVVLGDAIQVLLYEVRASDPLTLAVVAAVLLAVGAAACWLPARRATRLDVVKALRQN